MAMKMKTVKEPFAICFWDIDKSLQVARSTAVSVEDADYGFSISMPNEHGWCQWQITVSYSYEDLGVIRAVVVLHGLDVPLEVRQLIGYESSLPERVNRAIASVTSHWSEVHRLNKSLGTELVVKAYADWLGSK